MQGFTVRSKQLQRHVLRGASACGVRRGTRLGFILLGVKNDRRVLAHGGVTVFQFDLEIFF